MWRMVRPDGRRAQAVIDPIEGRARVLWFLDDRPLGARYFNDWSDAIQWADRLRLQYQSVGWRLTE